jgi:hypothetical protein
MYKRYLALAIGALVLLFGMAGRTFALAELNQVKPMPAPISNVSQPQKAASVTLYQAWELVNAYTQKWQPGAALVALNSIDHSQDSLDSGKDGRRRAWQAIILSAQQPKTQVVINLVDRAIQIQSQQSAESIDRQLLSNPAKIDSPDALNRVLGARPNFAPMNDKGKGFHFALEKSPSGNPVIAVLGSYNAMPARVSLDASSGTLIEAVTQSFESGGILYSQNKGQTWYASDLKVKMVTAVIPDPVAADQGYAVTTQNQQIVIYQTQDAGKTWSLFGTLPTQAGNWPFSLEVATDSSKQARLFVGTWTGVWSSTNGKDWAILPGLPEGPKQWLAIASSIRGYRLFVSITAGENKGLYASTNLSKWDKLSSDVLRLSKDFAKATVLATSEEQASDALLLDTKGETRIQIGEPVLRASGDFARSERFVIQSLARGTGQWSPNMEVARLPVSLASMTAAPDFPVSQTIIAGGFRSGIYRSKDAGKTWELILADPSQVVPGNNEIVGIAFLSSNTIIAINGGILTWKGF